MTKELALTLLNQGNNGKQILQILDSIADGMDDDATGVPAAEVAQSL
jgi:hypothetical protein